MGSIGTELEKEFRSVSQTLREAERQVEGSFARAMQLLERLGPSFSLDQLAHFANLFDISEENDGDGTPRADIWFRIRNLILTHSDAVKTETRKSQRYLDGSQYLYSEFLVEPGRSVNASPLPTVLWDGWDIVIDGHAESFIWMLKPDLTDGNFNSLAWARKTLIAAVCPETGHLSPMGFLIASVNFRWSENQWDLEKHLSYLVGCVKRIHLKKVHREEMSQWRKALARDAVRTKNGC